jgi:hypothetical protein
LGVPAVEFWESTLVVTGVFFGKPVDLRPWLTGSKSAEEIPWKYRDVKTLPNRIGSHEHVKLKEDAKDAVRVEEPIKIASDGVLEIESGVTLQMGPEAGIYCEGAIVAVGTDKLPITFQASDPIRGWKNTSINRPDSTGVESRFSYCRFRDAHGEKYDEPPVISGDDHKKFALNPSQNPLGGALFLVGTKNIEIDNCTFLNCRASKGGAMFVHDAIDLRISNCLFISNATYDRPANAGGGAVFVQSSNVNIEDTAFLWNTATNASSCGGACYLGFKAACSFKRCIFAANQSVNAGGALYMLNLPAKTPFGTSFTPGPRLSRIL